MKRREIGTKRRENSAERRKKSAKTTQKRRAPPKIGGLDPSLIYNMVFILVERNICLAVI